MKKLFLLFALISVTAMCEAQKWHALPSVVTVTDETIVPVSQAQASRKATFAKIKTWILTWIGELKQYKIILQSSSFHTAGQTAGTYAITCGDSTVKSLSTTFRPLSLMYIDDADYPTVNSVESKLRIRVQLSTNATAPTGNFTFGLYPVTKPDTSGGAGVSLYTIGTVVSGSTGATFTAPAADTLLSRVSSEFTMPIDGFYIIGMVTTATVAASSHLNINAQLQVRTY